VTNDLFGGSSTSGTGGIFDYPTTPAPAPTPSVPTHSNGMFGYPAAAAPVSAGGAVGMFAYPTAVGQYRHPSGSTSSGTNALPTTTTTSTWQSQQPMYDPFAVSLHPMNNSMSLNGGQQPHASSSFSFVNNNNNDDPFASLG
jgi:hypothetical protein